MTNRMWVIFLLAIALKVHAQEVHNFYDGARYLGMGGTMITVANDETALLANPAGLGRVRQAYGTILDPEADVSSMYPSVNSGKAISDPFALQAVSDSLNVSRTTPYHVRAQIFPSFVIRNFGIGIYWRKTLDAMMNSTGNSLQTFYHDDMAIALGYNFRFFDGRIKLGVTGKFISRIEVNQAIDPTAGPVDLKTYGTEGAGVGADVGLNLAGPWTWLPTISAVVRDVGGTAYTAGKGLRLQTTGIPTKNLQDIDVGFAVFPIHVNHVRSAFAFEYQKMNTAALAQDKTRFYHAGWELNMYDLFFLRAGMNQHYWTAGLELATEHTQIQLATYGEDIGPDGSPREDRRLVFKFAIRF